MDQALVYVRHVDAFVATMLETGNNEMTVVEGTPGRRSKPQSRRGTKAPEREGLRPSASARGADSRGEGGELRIELAVARAAVMERFAEGAARVSTGKGLKSRA